MSLWKDETIGGMYGPAMAITTQAEANEYFEALVERQLALGGGLREEAETLIKNNLGYYTGYYSAAIAQRVFTLFNCEHPIFGTVRLSPGRSALTKQTLGVTK